MLDCVFGQRRQQHRGDGHVGERIRQALDEAHPLRIAQAMQREQRVDEGQLLAQRPAARRLPVDRVPALRARRAGARPGVERHPCAGEGARGIRRSEPLSGTEVRDGCGRCVSPSVYPLLGRAFKAGCALGNVLGPAGADGVVTARSAEVDFLTSRSLTGSHASPVGTGTYAIPHLSQIHRIQIGLSAARDTSKRRGPRDVYQLPELRAFPHCRGYLRPLHTTGTRPEAAPEAAKEAPAQEWRAR
jgi:hypothetical protein